MDVTPSASYSITVRVELKNRAGILGRLTSEIGRLGGDIGAIDIVSVGDGLMVRDITINCRDDDHAKTLVDGIEALEDFKLVHYSDRTFLLHLGGNTISRWEAGRNVQTAAMDILVRLIRDLPGGLDYLRDHAA